VFAGEDITTRPPEKIAALGLIRTFQLVQLFQNLSVLENIQVGCHLHTRGGALSALVRSGNTQRAEREIEARARELLDFVGLEGRRRSRSQRARLRPAAAARNRAGRWRQSQSFCCSTSRRLGFRPTNRSAYRRRFAQSPSAAPLCC